MVELGMMVQNKMSMRSSSFGSIKGWEYLIKFSEGRQWGNDYKNQEYWLRYIGDWIMVKGGWTELGFRRYYMWSRLNWWTSEVLNDKLHLSIIGLKHRQHHNIWI